MSTVIKIIATWFSLTSLAMAEGGLSLPMGGGYQVKDGNIVTIAGKTMVKNGATKLFACGGVEVKNLPNDTFVHYQLVLPTKGPVPLLKEVKEICN